MIRATLAHPSGLASSTAAAARAALVREGAAVSGGWLDEPRALVLECDLPLDIARAALARFERIADVIVAPRPSGPYRLFVADMDSTMITVECLDELADYAGLKAQIAAITERAMRGELDFKASLIERVALLRGLPETAITETLAQRVRFTPGAETLIATLKAEGVRTMLVSGGFTAFAYPVGDALGFDRVAANTLEIEDGVLTGRVAEPILDRDAKLTALKAEAGAYGGPGRAVAIGDGANDSAMVSAAALGLGFRPKPALAEAAHGAIRHGNLLTVLWAMGIPAAKWQTQ